MARSGKAGPLQRLRRRVGDVVERKVVDWTLGPGVMNHMDERRRIDNRSPWPAQFRTFQGTPNDGETITVGRYTAIQPSAIFMHGGEHHTNWVSQFDAHLEDGEWVMAIDKPGDRGPIVVGNDAWIGFEAMITSGVTIGDGAVVGARTVVRRDVQPYEIVAGNPARHVGFRFEEPLREGLMRIKWWDWTDEKITAHADQIHSEDVAGFVASHDPELGATTCPVCS